MSKRKPRGYWTLERCMEDAMRFDARAKWQKESSGAYDRAMKMGWLDECCAHMGTSERKDWNLGSCKASAAKYASIPAWTKGEPNAVRAAYRLNIVDDCTSHMSNRQKVWSLEECVADAKKYRTASEWKNNSSGYASACYHGWLDACSEHMEIGHSVSANDVVYLWRDNVSGLHKVGITSDRIGENRISRVRSRNDMDASIVFMLKVPDARAVESQLLELGTDPELDSSIDGYTEFRVLSNDDLREAVSIAYEAALAA